MQVIYFPDAPRPRWPTPIAALGNFDGLHRGHQQLSSRSGTVPLNAGGRPLP